MSDPGLPPPPPQWPPQGWYPDPAGNPGVRWWTGTAWTEQTAAYTSWGPPTGYQSLPTGTTPITVGNQTVALSGWWRRVGGNLIDALVLLVPLIIFELLILGATSSNLFGTDVNGTARVALTVTLWSALISLIVNNAYAMILLRARGQTVGMMATGIKAVDLDGAPQLSWPQLWRRAITVYVLTGIWGNIWLLVEWGQHGLGTTITGLSFLTFVGFVGTLVTYLRPLVNPRHQTVQDQVARTVVIRT